MLPTQILPIFFHRFKGRSPAIWCTNEPWSCRQTTPSRSSPPSTAGFVRNLSTTTVSAITAMSQVNVLSIARTFLSPHTCLFVSRVGFHARWRNRKRTDVDKIRLKKCQVIFQRQVTEFAMGVFWDQSSEKEARSCMNGCTRVVCLLAMPKVTEWIFSS